jgi:Transglycosylase SLT domain
VRKFRLKYTWAVLLVMAGAAAEVDSAHSFFVDDTGVPTLTNRPKAYRNNQQYIEIQMAFDPVHVSSRYRSGGYTESDYHDLIVEYARNYRLSEALVYAVIKVESNFDANALSSAGAQGLMQLMPGTAAEMQITNAFDPAQNIAGGTQYLARLLVMFKGDQSLALAAYNAGPGNVRKHGGIPPFPETQQFVKNVQAHARDYGAGREHLAIQNTTPRNSVRVFKPTETQPVVVHFVGGTSQPARRVTETDTHYILESNGQTYAVRRALVTRIETI